MARKKGIVKYTDPEKGYGYILAETAQDPDETLLFEAKDVTSEIEELDEGSAVTYEEADNATRATQVTPAE
jgi:cold shock CspA family protein